MKKIFWKKSLTMPKKTEREDPLGVFNIHFVAKHQKIEGGKFLFSEKTHSAEKKLKGGTLWDFPTSILTQNSKKLKGGPFEGIFFEKKSRSAEKMKGGTLWSHPVWYVTRKNRKNLFGSVR